MPPRRRTTDLLVEDLGTELVLYDVPSHRVHRLNAVAAAVWLRCDGESTEEAIVADVEHGTAGRVGARAVARALSRLRAIGLVHDARGDPVPGAVSRRDVLARLSTAGAAVAAGSLVTSMLAPRPLMAQSAAAEVCETSSSSPNCFCTGCAGPPPSDLCTIGNIGAIVIQLGNGVCIPATDAECKGTPCVSRIAYECRRPNIWGRRRDLDHRRCGGIIA